MQESDTIKRVNKLIKEAVNFRKAQRDHEYINNEAHYEGLQWNLASSGGDSPFIVKSDINHLKNAVKIRLGSLYANTYCGKLEPLSPSDIEKIDNLNILYKNEWKRLKIDALIDKCIKSAAIFDNGYLKYGYDVDKILGGTGNLREGAITIEKLETANVYLDPNANNLLDCDYMVESMPMSMGRIKREKPDWYAKLKNSNISGGSIKDAETGNIFTGRDYTSQDDMIDIKVLYEKITKDEEYQDEDGTIEKVKVTRIIEYYVANDKVLLEENTDYPFDTFRIIPLQWEDQPQSPYGVPLVRGLTVPQKVANLIESAINNVAIHYTVPTWLVSDESGLDVDEVAHLINAVGVVWKVSNVENAIKQLEPPKVDKDMITTGQTFVGYIKEYAGVNDVYVGNIGTAGSTAEGTDRAINRATVIDNEPLEQITDFVERLTRTLIKFMTRYYVNENFYIREEKDDKYNFKEISMDSSYNDINYDFAVSLLTRSKNDRNRQYNLMKEIYQMQHQYKDPDAVIKVTDLLKAAELDNYNEVKKRLDSVTEKALTEKANLIVELMNIGQTKTPNGTTLIDAEELQEGIMDVLDDNNDLSVVEGIFNTYKAYQEKVTELNNRAFANTASGQIQALNQPEEVI